MKAGDGKMGWNMGKAETENPEMERKDLDYHGAVGSWWPENRRCKLLRHISVSEERGREA